MTNKHERKNPKKIPTPPKDAIGFVWSFRESGRSKSFFSSATFIMAGMARKVIVKANEPVSITFSIQQGFGVV